MITRVLIVIGVELLVDQQKLWFLIEIRFCHIELVHHLNLIYFNSVFNSLLWDN